MDQSIDNPLIQVDTPCIYVRRPSIEVNIGSTPLGGNNPIRLQSMANVSTMETEASVAQALRIIEAGADYIRYTAQGRKEATNLGQIRASLNLQGYYTPLIADIHFNPAAADEALEQIEKVRVNPGNYVDTKTSTPREWTDEVFAEMHNKVCVRFGEFVRRAKALGRAIRIGVNHGSLSERMVMLYGDTPEGMVQSALEYLDVCREYSFTDVVISMKSSNTRVMTSAVRLLVQRLKEGGYPAYPLHLGVTEAGEGEDGRIKSAVGIGSLLMDGIGDTIRVSLSEDPEFEIPVAATLVSYITSRPQLPEAMLIDAPSWDEYTLLAQNSRLRSTAIANVVGGANLPIVLAPHATYQEDMETKPDFLIDSDHNTLIACAKELERAVECTELSFADLSLELFASLKQTPEKLILLSTQTDNPVRDWRASLSKLARAGVTNPIILVHSYSTDSLEDFRLQAASDLGSVLLDGWANGLCISAPKLPIEEVIKTELGILQATRLRMSKTEFISCPGCGRTLYNLQETIAKVKQATSHLKGLKIGIMGCIVNGPGEMADADYGYVGAAPGKIDLYKGQECIRRGVPQEYAVEQLIDLIKQEGDWQEPQEASR